MTSASASAEGPDWFRALLDSAQDVYFRYALEPRRRFEYLSPSIERVSGHPPHAFYNDPALCLGLVSRADRRVLKQLRRSRRGLVVTLTLLRDQVALPVEVRSVPVIRTGRVVAVEGLLRVKTEAPSGSDARIAGTALDSTPIQQRLTALLVEVHSLLHTALPSLNTPHAGRVRRLGELTFDEDRLIASESGAEVALTGKEMALLRFLLARPGRVITRGELLRDVWGYHYDGDDRTVDVHVSRLRKKLPSLRGRLVAIKQVGYRLDADARAHAESA